MELEKYKEKIDSSEVVEELIDLSKKIFANSSDDAKGVVEMFIIQANLMGKRNMVRSFDDSPPHADLSILEQS